MSIRSRRIILRVIFSLIIVGSVILAILYVNSNRAKNNPLVMADCPTPSFDGKNEHYAGLVPVGKAPAGYEAVARKFFDGTSTTLTIGTNMLPPPQFEYDAWLVTFSPSHPNTICYSLNIGRLELAPFKVYAMTKTGPGKFYDNYEIVISDGPQGSSGIENPILRGKLEYVPGDK